MAILKSEPMVTPNLPRKTKRKHTRFQQLNYIEDVIGDGINDGEYRVFKHLFRHADSAGYASISARDIGSKIGKSKRQVQRLIKSLMQKKHLKLIQRGCNITQRPNRYLLVMGQEKTQPPKTNLH